MQPSVFHALICDMTELAGLAMFVAAIGLLARFGLGV